MPKRIEVGDLVLKTGNYYGLDMDYGLVTEVLKDKYTDTRYLQVHWLYDKHTETVKEEEVKPSPCPAAGACGARLGFPSVHDESRGLS